MSAFLKNVAKYGWPFALVVVLWYIALKATPCWYGAPNSSSEFGDMFGAINALFSGLAFAGVLVALFMQREDLRNQDKEIKKQNDTLARQQFEATFFGLLKELREVESSVSQGGISGPVAFNEIESGFRKALTNYYKSDETNNAENRELLYQLFHSKNLLVLRWIRIFASAASYLPYCDKNRAGIYATLLSAMLTYRQAVVLMSFCETSEGSLMLKGMCEEYSLLRELKPFWNELKRDGLVDSNWIYWATGQVDQHAISETITS